MSLSLAIVDPPYPTGVPWWGNATPGTHYVPQTVTSQVRPWDAGLWNGGYCHVCAGRILGACTRDHRPDIDTGYRGTHREEADVD